MEFAAALYDGATAARHEVIVRAGPEGLLILPRGELWPWSETRVRREAVLRLERGAAVLVVGSESMAPVLRELERYTRIGPVQGHAPALLITLALAVPLLLWLGYRYGLPWAGERAASSVPVQWEEKLGESAAQGLLARERIVEPGAALDVVGEITGRLRRQLPASPYSYQVSIVESHVVNAGALPAGRIFVFSALLKECDSADEFAAVLAHEMIHVEKRHGLKNLGRQAALGLILALLGSPDSLAAAFGSQIAGLKYQRGDEQEADEEGLRLMARAGFDPAAAARFFQKLATPESGPRLPEYLSTHPDPEGRAERLRRLTRSMGTPAEPVIPPADWQAAMAGLR